MPQIGNALLDIVAIISSPRSHHASASQALITPPQLNQVARQGVLPSYSPSQRSSLHPFYVFLRPTTNPRNPAAATPHTEGREQQPSPHPTQTLSHRKQGEARVEVNGAGNAKLVCQSSNQRCIMSLRRPPWRRPRPWTRASRRPSSSPWPPPRRRAESPAGTSPQRRGTPPRQPQSATWQGQSWRSSAP